MMSTVVRVARRYYGVMRSVSQDMFTTCPEMCDVHALISTLFIAACTSDSRNRHMQWAPDKKNIL